MRAGRRDLPDRRVRPPAARELLALRWRDVDFANDNIRVRAGYTNGQLSTPKSGKVRAVPLAPEVAEALAA